MPTPDYEIKHGDTPKPLTATLSDEDGTANLDGATVTMVLRSHTTGRTFTFPMEVVGSPADGNVRYTWAANDIPLADHYHGEFLVDRNGREDTFPTPGYFLVYVYESLN